MMEQLQQALVNVIIALIGLAGAYGVFYLNKLTVKVKLQTEQLKDEKQKKLLSDAIDRINDLAQKTVAQIEQTTAKDLRKAVADGKVNKAELEDLGKQAAMEVYSQLSSDAKTILSQEMNDVQDYIMKTIESSLLNLKNSSTNNSTPVINNSNYTEVPSKSYTVNQ